jgi:hypothetical protein
MTVQIDTTAENNALRLVTQGSHPSAPSVGHVVLYYVTGTASPGLYTKLSNGQQIGPFITGSSASLKSYWAVDAPPTSPTSQDDEFNDGSLNGKWSEYDPGSKLTVTESSTYKHLQLLSASGGGAWTVAGIYQAIPAGDFTITVRIAPLAPGANYYMTGLALWEDATNSAAKIQDYVMSIRGGGLNLSSHYYTAYNNLSTTPVDLTINYNWSSFYYMRIRRNSTNYYWDWSNDGLSWNTYGTPSAVNPSFTPTHFGISVMNYSTNTVMTIHNFFRYVASDVGITGILAGQAANIYA